MSRLLRFFFRPKRRLDGPVVRTLITYRNNWRP
jgi:hypothetical protein